jgi:hypothetical protein
MKFLTRLSMALVLVFTIGLVLMELSAGAVSGDEYMPIIARPAPDVLPLEIHMKPSSLQMECFTNEFTFEFISPDHKRIQINCLASVVSGNQDNNYIAGQTLGVLPIELRMEASSLQMECFGDEFTVNFISLDHKRIQVNCVEYVQ